MKVSFLVLKKVTKSWESNTSNNNNDKKLDMKDNENDDDM